MDDEAATHALLVFGLSLLVGPAVGALVGRFKTFFWGAGIGALLIGCAGLYGAVTVGWQRYQSIAGTASTQGSLVEFVEERSKDSKGYVTTTRAPLVEYTAADGQKRRVKGLGGSLSDKEWGDAVEVRYSTADPAQALVADFQNMWGIVWGSASSAAFRRCSACSSPAWRSRRAAGAGRRQCASRRPRRRNGARAARCWRTWCSWPASRWCFSIPTTVR